MKSSASNRQRLLLILIGVGLLLLLGDSLVLTPLTKTWQSRRDEIARLQKNVTEGRSIMERGPRTQALWSEMQTQAFPKDPSGMRVKYRVCTL